MNEYFFATMRDNEDVYYYNGQGLYVIDGESLINELCELMYPQIKPTNSTRLLVILNVGPM
jgi:hypothetical protein